MIRFMGALVVLITYLSLMYTLVILKKDNGLINFTWGGGVILLALYTFLFYSSFNARQFLATVLILLWGTRLIRHLVLRYKKDADPRFADWGKKWGNYAFLLIFAWIALLQGMLTIIMATPIILINCQASGPLNLLDIVGYTLWVFGFFCQSIADYQLRTFLKDQNNKDRILTEGLWRYSRHPNYFGETCMWLGLSFIALSVPYGFLGFIAPITITGIFFFYSIPLLENVFRDHPHYQRYKRKTSMFILWFSEKMDQ